MKFARILGIGSAPIAAFALFAAAILPRLATAQIGSMDTPAGSKAYVLYVAEAQTIPAAKRANLELRFQVVSGFHVNSHTPRLQYLIPTTLTLQTAGGVKAGELEYPAGKLYTFSFDPADKLDVYSGSFTVNLPVVAAPGDHTLDGTLRYQACDNASCYPPRTLAVKVPFTAKP